MPGSVCLQVKNPREKKSPESFYKYQEVSKECFAIRVNVREQYTSGSNETVLSSGFIEKGALENGNFADGNPVIPSTG